MAGSPYDSTVRPTPNAPRRPIAVVAVGGHAFMQKGEAGTVEDHLRNSDLLARNLLTLLNRGYDLVVTHGNGPQVGNLLLQQETATSEVPTLPLDVLVAQTQGSLGYILQQSLLNHARAFEHGRYVVTMVTEVVVDPKDPAFAQPTKPVGPFYGEEEAKKRAESLGWTVVEQTGRGWRRVVPSPRPTKVVQARMVADSVRQGHIVLAGGGGGVPVTVDSHTGRHTGVEAVIDKDLTSAVLAEQVGADLFLILTEVPQVYVGFGTPEQRGLDAVTLPEMERLVAQGEFPAGSMGPKVEAIVQFLRAGGPRGLVTHPDCLDDALDGLAGTHFVGRI